MPPPMMPEDAPHIKAECVCGFVFDAKYGMDCPKCHNTEVKWARIMSVEEYTQEPPLDPTAIRDIAELDKLFALEDTRT